MDREPIPPFFFLEGGTDLTVLTWVGDEAHWPEAIDVENDEFMIFDAVGHWLVDHFEDDESKLILELIDDVRHEADLRERLIRYLDVVGRTPDRSLPFREFTVACARAYLEGEREARSRRWWRRRRG